MLDRFAPRTRSLVLREVIEGAAEERLDGPLVAVVAPDPEGLDELFALQDRVILERLAPTNLVIPHADAPFPVIGTAVPLAVAAELFPELARDLARDPGRAIRVVTLGPSGPALSHERVEWNAPQGKGWN